MSMLDVAIDLSVSTRSSHASYLADLAQQRSKARMYYYPSRSPPVKRCSKAMPGNTLGHLDVTRSTLPINLLLDDIQTDFALDGAVQSPDGQMRGDAHDG